jgi:hypothetical protein
LLKLLVLPANVRPNWKVIARYKHSRLFGLFVSNEEKKFYNIGTGCLFGVISAGQPKHLVLDRSAEKYGIGLRPRLAHHPVLVDGTNPESVVAFTKLRFLCNLLIGPIS